MAKIDWLATLSATETKADEGCKHRGWQPKGIEWTRCAASLVRAEYITLVGKYNALQERIEAGTVPALPEQTDKALDRRTVDLYTEVLDETTQFVVDFHKLDDPDTAQPIDIVIVHAWAGSQDVQHWLDEGSHAALKVAVAEMLRGEGIEYADQADKPDAGLPTEVGSFGRWAPRVRRDSAAAEV